jgi:2-amino-4-hydroxy-6-hydroxymethyldihydropteridine diphosphokinase
MERVILGLGSNKGNSINFLKNAVIALSSFLQDVCFSSVYKTAPQDYLEQSDFYNLVLLGLYNGEPLSLLQEIHRIELQNGRKREEEIRKGPRTLDIDILFFGNLKFQSEVLTIPHPAIKKRAFVLTPLLELLPDFDGIEENSSYKAILASLKDQRVEKFANLAIV